MAEQNGSSLGDVACFLRRLEEARIHHTLATVREGAVMVQVALPGERWEIEFFPDRPPEVEVFRSHGTIEGTEALDRLLDEHGGSDEASAAVSKGNRHR